MQSDILHKTLAVALLVATCGGIWLGIAEPVRDHYRESTVLLTDQTAQLDRWQQKLTQQQQTALVTELLQPPNYQRFYYVGESDALIAAQLQARLRATLGRHAAELRSMQNLEPKQQPHFTLLGVRVQWRGDTQAVRRVLHELQSQPPLLFIEQLTLQAPHLSVPGELPASGTAVITASMDVFGAKWVLALDEKAK